MKRISEAILILAIILCAAGAFATTITYNYDQDGRLTRAEYHESADRQPTIDYQYDLDSNILTREPTDFGMENLPPVIDSFTADPTEGVAPLTVAFTCQAHDPEGGNVVYELDFGDGSELATSTNGTFSHTYENTGTYNATCTAYDDAEGTATSDPVTVSVNEPVMYTLSLSIDGQGTVTGEGINCGEDCQEEYDQGDSVTLTATPDEGFVFSGWGGDCSSCGSEPTCALVMDADKSCTATFDMIPNEPPVIDSFTADPTEGVAPLEVSFTCQAHDPEGGNVVYEVDFGDGSELATSLDGTFSHTYETPGTYNATCTAYDDAEGSSTSDPVTVSVNEAATPTWQDITELVTTNRSRTLYDRIHRAFFVLIDVENTSTEDLSGPIRMVIEDPTIPVKTIEGVGLTPDGVTDDGDPYFIIVPEGGSLDAGELLEDLRVSFELQRRRLNFGIRIEQFGLPPM